MDFEENLSAKAVAKTMAAATRLLTVSNVTAALAAHNVKEPYTVSLGWQGKDDPISNSRSMVMNDATMQTGPSNPQASSLSNST